jgi:hypothetical protein
MKTITDDPLQIGANALANSSPTPVGKSELIAILATGDGPGHLVRALFEDCSLESLDRMAMEAGLTAAQIRAAYLVARVRHRARNADMEGDAAQF